MMDAAGRSVTKLSEKVEEWVSFPAFFSYITPYSK